MSGMLRRILTAVCVVVTLVFVLWTTLLNGGGKALPAARTQDVKTIRAEKQEIESVVTAPGVVQEALRRDIYAPQALRVLSVYVRKGDRVKAGDKLLQYDTAQLESQYAQLLLSRRIQEKTLESTKNADTARSTAALEAMLSQAIDAMNKAWDAYDRAKAAYGSLKALYDRHRLSKKDLDKAGAAVEEASSALKTAENAYDAAKANLDDVVRANGQAVKQKASQVEIQQANLDMLDLKIKDVEKALSDIHAGSTAPITGVVTGVNVEQGGFAALQLPALTVADDSRLEIRASIKEYDACVVKPGQKVAISCDTFENGAAIPGTVREVSEVADKTINVTGSETSVEAVISIDKPNGLLIPGLNTTCRVTAEKKGDAVVISYVAIKDNLDGSKSVFVVGSEGRLESRTVKLGISSDTDVEVLDGLKEGDLVVTNWQPDFKPGDRARVIG